MHVLMYVPTCQFDPAATVKLVFARINVSFSSKLLLISQRHRRTFVTAPRCPCARASSAVWRPPSSPAGEWLRPRIRCALWASTAPSPWSRNALGLGPAPQSSPTRRRSGAARRACWEVAAVLCSEPSEVGMFLIRWVSSFFFLSSSCNYVTHSEFSYFILKSLFSLQSIINVQHQPVEMDQDKCKTFLQKYEQEIRHFGKWDVKSEACNKSHHQIMCVKMLR